LIRNHQHFSLLSLIKPFKTKNISAMMEINKHLAEKQLKPELKTEGRVRLLGWKRRGLAFLVDSAIFWALWGVIDNLVTVPISEGLMSFGELALFCLYFGLAEGSGGKRASLGKRIARIEVVSRDGQQPTSISIIARSAILAVIFVLDWGKVLSLIPFTSPPFLMLTLAWTIPASIILYNVLLSIRGPERVMLHDGLTYTKVIRSIHASTKTLDTLPTPLPPRKREWPRPALCWKLVIAVSLVGIIFIGTSSNIPEKSAEEAIAQKLGVRSRVDVKDMREWKSSVGKSVNFSYSFSFEKRASKGHLYDISIEHKKMIRSLQISIWMPFIIWNDAMIHRMVGVALQSLTIEPGYFDSGTIKVHTGPFFFYYRSFSSELNISTALMCAAWDGHTDTVKQLLDKGVNVHVKYTDGKTALEYAKERNYTQIVELLKQHEAEEN